MLKIIGSAAIIMAAGLFGIKKYTELSDRKKLLSEILDGAEKIRTNLKCMCMPLYECFLNGGDFFKKAAERMAEGELPSSAVHDTAEALKLLSAEDKEAILRFALGLCAENCEGQLRNIELFIKEMERNNEKAKNELETKGKLYLKGSLLGAAAAVLVLF